MSKPRILFYDLESSANELRGFGHYDVSPIKITRYSELLSAAWKLRGEAKPTVKARKHYLKVNGDKEICEALYKELSKADLIVAHNLKRFDHQVANARFVKHGIFGVPNATVIDTLELAKKNFKFSGGNSLKELAIYLGVALKSETSKDLWNKCMDSEPGSFTEMGKYNGQDTIVLEQVFNKLIAGSRSIPNLALLDPKAVHGKVCPNPICHSPNVQKRGLYVTVKGRQQRQQCTDCGHWFTTKVAA